MKLGRQSSEMEILVRSFAQVQQSPKNYEVGDIDIKQDVNVTHFIMDNFEKVSTTVKAIQLISAAVPHQSQ